MKKQFGLIAFSLVTMVLLTFTTSCSDSSISGISGTHNKEGEPLEITVRVFANNKEFDKYMKDELGVRDRVKRDGLAEWFVRNDTGEVVSCDIYVKEIRSVNDKDRMYEWGHELAHCIYGTYHKE